MVDVKIERIGARGDGVADTASGPVFVPAALPDETWQLTDGAAPICLEPAPDRQEPRCPHFGVCGGCIAQHMPDSMYLNWKRRLVVDALAAQNIEAVVTETAACPPASRRRAALSAVRTANGIVLGFHARATNTIVDIQHCAILTPGIMTRIDGLRAVAELLAPPRGELRIVVLETRAGLDIAVADSAQKLDPAMSASLSRVAEANGIARLIVDGRDVVQFIRPALVVDEVEVMPPASVFLQASEAAERVLIDRTVAAAGKAKRVADLFCGIGTFALALARKARVFAADSDGDAIAALEAAWRGTERRKPIETRVRDLFREPLSRKELEPFDAVVFDPPRAGAKAQAEMLAKSKVPVIAAVSCNPATFARDARILIDGGYKLEAVTPVDQFVWSEHVELVARLVR